MEWRLGAGRVGVARTLIDLGRLRQRRAYHPAVGRENGRNRRLWAVVSRASAVAAGVMVVVSTSRNGRRGLGWPTEWRQRRELAGAEAGCGGAAVVKFQVGAVGVPVTAFCIFGLPLVDWYIYQFDSNF